jgi:hypothetical protein
VGGAVQRREIALVNHLSREVSMKGRIQGLRAKWIRVGLVVAALIASHALHNGSAEAATTAPQPHGGAHILAAHDAPASPGILLATITSQSLPAWFKVSGDGRTLTVAAIAVNMNCTSGAQFVLPDGFVRVAISKSGTLHANYSQPPTAGSAGETYTLTDSITARLNHRHTRLSGVWHLSVNYSFTNGMSDQCESGPVRFVATQ